jgi:hypothetical protein
MTQQLQENDIPGPQSRRIIGSFGPVSSSGLVPCRFCRGSTYFPLNTSPRVPTGQDPTESSPVQPHQSRRSIMNKQSQQPSKTPIQSQPKDLQARKDAKGGLIFPLLPAVQKVRESTPGLTS